MPKLEHTFEAVSLRYLLLDNYKKLKISEDELCVLLMCDHLIKQGNKLITADLLRIKMSFRTAKLDEILVKLLEKKLIEYVPSGKGMITSLDPLRDKLYEQFRNDLAKEKNNSSSDRKAIISTLVSYCEKAFNRKLSPIENDLICAWLDDDYDVAAIKAAVDLCLMERKKTFRSIDRALKASRAKDDISKEGYSAVSQDGWGKDIQKTIEIAKTKWLEDEPKK